MQVRQPHNVNKGGPPSRPPSPPRSPRRKPPRHSATSTSNASISAPPVPLNQVQASNASSSIHSSLTNSQKSDESSTVASADAATTAGSTCSRTELRREIALKRRSLTLGELDFLESLARHGENTDVDLARERLSDTNLFFERREESFDDYSPKSVLTSPSDEGDENPRDGMKVVPIGDAANGGGKPLSLAERKRSASVGSGSSVSNINAIEKPSGVRRRSISLGSDRRREHLAQRRASELHGKMWRAHESGLAVSDVASERNVLIEESFPGVFHRTKPPKGPASSIDGGSARSGLQQKVKTLGQLKKLFASSGNEFHSTCATRSHSFLSTSTVNLLEKGGPEDRPGEEDIFRDGMCEMKKRFASSGQELRSVNPALRSSSFLSTTTADLLAKGGPENRPGEDDIFRDSSTSNSDSQWTNKSKIDIDLGDGLVIAGGPFDAGEAPDKSGRKTRQTSCGTITSRVTFKDHPEDELLGDYDVDTTNDDAKADDSPAKSNATTAIVTNKPPKRPSAIRLRRRERNVSSGSTGSAISALSVPSIRHAAPIRSDSAISIISFPSIQHARALRSDSLISITSIPGIQHGRALRSNSVVSITSIPGIQHAHPLRSQSIGAASVQSLESDTDARESKEGERAQVAMRRDEQFEDGGSPEPAWSAPLPRKQRNSLVKRGQLPKPMLMRMASRNNYAGEGIEVFDFVDGSSVASSLLEVESISNARKYRSMVSNATVASSRQSITSFDDSYALITGQKDVVDAEIKRNLSHDDLDSFLRASADISKALKDPDINTDAEVRGIDEEVSWDLTSDADQQDAWNVLKDEYAVGYGAHGLPFVILGTSATDESAAPHVLSPPLMESLQAFFPFSVSEDNFWMKYSLLRDGASLHSLLQHVRGAKHTIIAMETVDGEVFGSFTASPWRKKWNYYGTGEAFLWRMRQTRKTLCHSIIDQARLESGLDVYPWTGENNFIQLCTHNKIAIGGGDSADVSGVEEKVDGEPSQDKENAMVSGFGLAIESDLLYGTSSSCATFANPPLSQEHPDGSPFEIVNLEVWTLTPCMSLEEAEKLELGKLFLDSHS